MHQIFEFNLHILGQEMNVEGGENYLNTACGCKSGKGENFRKTKNEYKSRLLLLGLKCIRNNIFLKRRSKPLQT